MPIVFGIIGVTLVAAGVRGQTAQLTALLKADFTGSPSYVRWMVAILLIGAIGYIQDLRTISRLFMAIVLVGLLFSNRGFFAQFTKQTESVPTPTPSSATPGATQGSSSSILSGLPNLTTLSDLVPINVLNSL
jgi:hypothetical protein